MKITSICLSCVPFISNTDATRLQMASKQIQQTITSLNCDIPYIISSNYIDLLSSNFGIFIAEDDGSVLWQDEEIVVIFYKNKQQILTKQIPTVKKTSANYGSTLRFCLPKGSEFRKGDIIFEYDCFTYGIPSFGYNTNIAYMIFAGYNHEDAMICSESFAERATISYVDKIFIPIYEQSIFQKQNTTNDGIYTYFPRKGEYINDGLVAVGGLIETHSKYSSQLKLETIFKNSKISDLNQLLASNNYKLPKIETKVKNGQVIDIKVHRLKKDIKPLFQKELEIEIQNLYDDHSSKIVGLYNELYKDFREYTKTLLKKYYINTKRKLIFDDFNLKDALYLIEIDIASVNKSNIGDKFANRYAGKGVLSLIIPDELRPVGAISGKPIDMMLNTFGVPSRMNWGQLLETLISKAVQQVDDNIKSGKDLIGELSRLDRLIYELHGNEGYYLKYKNLLKELRSNSALKSKFIERVNQSNLFIEGKPFKILNTRKINEIINNNFISLQEPVKLSRKLFKYIKDKLGSSVHNITMMKDEFITNLTTGPQYMLKLSKIADDIMWSRDFGPIKITTGQPLRGKSKKGGVRLGNMEIDGILAHGCDLALKELLTVKSDSKQLKQELLMQLLKEGQFKLSDADYDGKSVTKTSVDIIVEFLGS